MGKLKVSLHDEDGDLIFEGEIEEKNIQLLYDDEGKVEDAAILLHTSAPELELGGVERVWVDDTDQSIFAVHAPADCVGRPCCIHAPSDHHMRDFPRHWRFDRRIMERICPHGIGHPDPDDAAYQRSAGLPYDGVHGCDGCCVDPANPVQTGEGVWPRAVPDGDAA